MSGCSRHTVPARGLLKGDLFSKENRMRGIKIVVVAATLAMASCTAPALRAKPPPTRVAAVPTVQLEVIDKQQGNTNSVKFALPIAEQGRSELSANAGGAHYRLQLARVGEGPGAPLQFEIERRSVDGRRERSMEIRVTVRLRRGARVRLSRLEAGKNAGTEVFATLS